MALELESKAGVVVVLVVKNLSISIFTPVRFWRLADSTYLNLSAQSAHVCAAYEGETGDAHTAAQIIVLSLTAVHSDNMFVDLNLLCLWS